MKFIKVSLILFLAFSLDLSAQPVPPDSNNNAPIPGLVWLAVAGAAVGAKKVYSKKDQA